MFERWKFIVPKNENLMGVLLHSALFVLKFLRKCNEKRRIVSVCKTKESVQSSQLHN